MIPIRVDLGETILEFALTKDQTEGMLEAVTKRMTALIAKNWDTEAKLNLGKSRSDYRRSLIVVDKGRFEGMVILKGIVPNMIENGISAFDLKVGFSNSTKKKMKADGSGWYLTIPFRFATPGALGEDSVFSGVMPTEVYEVAKRVGTVPQKLIPAPYNLPKVRPKVLGISKVFEEYKNKSSIYAGIKKTSKSYEAANQSTYTSFRRVSDTSDPDMFIHSGILARNLAEKAINRTNVGREVDKIVDSYLNFLGF